MLKKKERKKYASEDGASLNLPLIRKISHRCAFNRIATLEVKLELKKTNRAGREKSNRREGTLQAPFGEFFSALPRQPGSSPSVLTGQVPTLPPHLSGSPCARLPEATPWRRDWELSAWELPFRSASPDRPQRPETEAGVGWAEGNSYPALGTPPSAPSFCPRLAAFLAPMQPSLTTTSRWPSGGGGGELRGSGQGNGAG